MKRQLVSIVAGVVIVGNILAVANKATANDSMFPPAPVAQSTINFDKTGFIINGQRVFVASAGMEYARVPRALWADRLMRLKRAGFNCIEMYTFWNYHEAKKGVFDFSGNADLDAYLKLAKSMGFYAIVRVGPYYCAEWDSGGYPIWLRNIPNLAARTNDNAAFEHYVGRYFSHLLPIVVNNQIDRGGNVIMVQLENEHPWAWGTDGLNNEYFRFLQKEALKAGLEVPYFFSGLNHGGDPAGGEPWSSATRTSPWFTTEFWCDWFSDYGENAGAAREKDFDTWKILAYGGNGYNYYMAHGGTNFDYYNSGGVAASYDYGAAVGQGGDLRPEYYKFKRAAWFARSFQNILETSDNATGMYQNAATNKAVAVTARASASGTILFLANAGNLAQPTQVRVGGISYPATGPLTINAREIVPVVTGYSLAPGVTLKVAPTRILGVTKQGATTTMVIYGQAGAPAEIYFDVPPGTTVTAGASALNLSGTNITLKTTYPASGVSEYSFRTDSQRIRVLTVADTLADDTWFVDAGSQNYVVVGPQFVGKASVSNGSLQIMTEKPYSDLVNVDHLLVDRTPVVAYGPGDSPISMSEVSKPDQHPASAALTSWQTMTGIAKAAPSYSTSGWLASTKGPQPMGSDDDITADAWYRTTVTVPTTGTYIFGFGNVGDRMVPFVDGTAVPAANVLAKQFTASLSAGRHTIAIFTAHSGRPDLYSYVGPLNTEAAVIKGLSGPAWLGAASSAGTTSITHWSVMPTTSSAVGTAPPSPTALGWSKYIVGNDAFNKQTGYAWFQTTLPTDASADHEIVSFSSVDDNGWVYLNGKLIAQNRGWDTPFTVNLASAWKANGPNILTVLVQNTSGPGGLDSEVTFTAVNNFIALTNWVQQGGPGDANANSGWSALERETAYSGPQFFKSTFTAEPPGTSGAHPIWRVTTTGLSHGSVWVNGHNLGRYPETIPAPGMYIPECWLKSGTNANTLVIYDEGGNLPDRVQVQVEQAASRDVQVFQSEKAVPSAQ